MSHYLGMRWSKALKLAIPVWLLICAGIAAINYAADAKAHIANLIVALTAAYPLSAFILKATAEDIAKWGAAVGSKDGD